MNPWVSDCDEKSSEQPKIIPTCFDSFFFLFRRKGVYQLADYGCEIDLFFYGSWEEQEKR